ncbi:MAG TPA: ribosomal protein L13e [Nitrososphaera sp.]|jgi:ribosomal protein L13E|nr:ribosomal protein L13e [Nitrososphaera sp.]
MQAAKPTVRNGYIVRTGRGYSFGELVEAGLDPRVARKSGIPVDVLRRSKHAENIEQLKSIVKTMQPRESTKKSKKKKE